MRRSGFAGAVFVAAQPNAGFGEILFIGDGLEIGIAGGELFFEIGLAGVELIEMSFPDSGEEASR